MANDDDGLKIINISNPDSTSQVRHIETGENSSRIEVQGDYAYIAGGLTSMPVLDISNPDNPIKIGDFAARSNDIVIKDQYAYIANYGDLTILDVSNPEDLEEVGNLKTDGYIYEIAVQGDYAYVANSLAGFKIINISNPENPEQVGVFDIEDDGAHHVAVQGEYAYVTFDSLVVLDISDPTSPIQISSFDSYIYAIAVQDDYVYITRNNVFCILDNSDPTNLVEIGSYVLDDYCWDIVIHNNYAYMANERAGLTILDISDPTNIIKTGFFDTGDMARGVAVNDDYALVADGEDGIYIIRNNELDNTKIENNANNIPQKISLNQNYPNPFNPTTKIEYEIHQKSHITLKIYDISGNEIETLINNNQSAGKYTIIWNAANYSSGLYFYKISTNNFVKIKKCMLLK